MPLAAPGAKRTIAEWEETFGIWAQPPGKTEQERCENAISAVSTAVIRSPKLKLRRIKVFPQGSYRNRVNVRQDSDIDVGVMLYDYFLAQYPDGKRHADFGNSDANYPFSQFKDELEEALVDHFGRIAVVRGNKAFDIKATSYHIEADVAPFFEFRQYWDSGDYRAGVALIPDRGWRIENFPERLADHWPATPLHYENGVAKNERTGRRYKGLVRILKKIRNEIADAGNPLAPTIPGYLLECLAWNAPDFCYDGDTWTARVGSVIAHLWTGTKDDASCKTWCEVDNIKYLFHPTQPWSRAGAHDFLFAAFAWMSS